jgi:hypothetical protein
MPDFVRPKCERQKRRTSYFAECYKKHSCLRIYYGRCRLFCYEFRE